MMTSVSIYENRAGPGSTRGCARFLTLLAQCTSTERFVCSLSSLFLFCVLYGFDREFGNVQYDGYYTIRSVLRYYYKLIRLMITTDFHILFAEEIFENSGVRWVTTHNARQVR